MDAAEWLRPGLTSNWDEELRERIVAGFGAEGVRGQEDCARLAIPLAPIVRREQLVSAKRRQPRRRARSAW
ncbi:MAG: hypothetical protein L6Q95_06855 [Planctomycetes bacterium]|nr:hypothetical protein [Planctomycetota bacterium]